MSVRQHAATALTLVLALLTWIVVVAITVPQAQSVFPQPNGDYGFFTAVAERIAMGDRLYVDIWDNKDPFVFYSIAMARGSLGVWGAWGLEVLWIVAVAVAAWSLATWMRIPDPVRLFVALVAAPFLMVGLAYFMGSTHVPGIALTLTAFTAWVRNRPVIAGALLVALTFFKLIMLPLAVVMIIVASVVTTRVALERPLWGRLLITYMGGVTAVFVLLGLRGELLPYLRAMVDNVLYSQAPLVPQDEQSVVRWIIQHIVILVNPHVFAILVTSAGVLVAFGIFVLRRHRGRTTPMDITLWWVCASAFVVEVFTIAAIGKWLHHALILTVSSVLILVLVGRMFQRIHRAASALTIGAMAVLTFILAGLPNPGMYGTAIRDLPANLNAAFTTDRFTSALRNTQPGSFAIISQGNLAPRSFDFPTWALACRHIAQRHFDPDRTFTETLACLPSADVVVIAPDVERREGFDRFNAFLDEVNALSARGRACSEVDGFRICAKR